MSSSFAVGYFNSILPENVTTVFCWGEIDCRCHVHKYQPWQKTIDVLVEKYLEVIRFHAVNRTILLFNVVPPPRKEEVLENSSFPFLGSNEERLSYVKYMNEKLKESEFTFIDVYNQYSEDGFLKLEYSDNHVHIANEKPLIEWLENYKDRNEKDLFIM